MSVVGHFSWGIFIYSIIPYPFNWIILFVSHFILDLYPDYFTTGLLTHWKDNLFYGIGELIGLLLLIIFSVKQLMLGWTIIPVFIIALFPDITEAIYMFIQYFKPNLPRKFWFNHLGWFPVKVNKWQYSYPGFSCLTAYDTVLFDYVFIGLLFILYIGGVI